MKLYIVFAAMAELNKIQLIKLVRRITSLGLRDAKEFVEARIMPPADHEIELPFRFSLQMTELQLGKWLISRELDKTGFFTPCPVEIERFEEVPTPDYIDISKL